MSAPSRTAPTISPTLRYRDAAAAIDWLVRAFGFEQRVVYPGADGQIAHAELSFGNGLVMLGTARDDEFGKLVVTPAECGGKSTQCIYVLVDQVKDHHARAIAAGAQVTVPLREEPHGTMYCCQDLEGHVWSFGDYDPWDSPAAA